ncbi:AAA family ATPase [Pseudomonas sp. GM80]|uniref:AAA family ATPase n=1 Tax=Pseudomonas sp. GM80 TaxID=1144339 RepID=UPI00026F7112|nr:AAA family ATPase [Pseudomonas sp. GM80]EJN36115.1 putative ATP-binding protein involved in virulence [Pseudomonas sp. GM80]
MRLDRLHIQNFRCYEDATFDFQPGFNLVVGVNGSGKTSLLQAVAASFVDVPACMGFYNNSLSESDARFVIDNYAGRVRFERKYPVTLKANGDIFGPRTWLLTRLLADEITYGDSSLVEAVREYVDGLNQGKNADLPLLAFYRGNRRWSVTNVSAEYSATQKTSRLDGYKNWHDCAADIQDFESWIIGKTLEQLQSIHRSSGIMSIFDDELTWINAAIKCALPDSTGLYYDLPLRSILVNFGSGLVIPFNELSDGQRGLIALIADIARRMCILNPHMGKDVLKNTSGVVIIDELDIHLHPAWQRSIVPALRQAFPKVQFIAASHSPQIIGSLKPQEVIVLNNGDPSHPRVTYGLDSSSVLEEVMGVNQREPEIESLLSELFSTLEDNDLKKAKSQLAALKKKAPDLPEFAGAEALIRRKEILGK